MRWHRLISSHVAGMASPSSVRLVLLWQQCQNFLFEVGDLNDPPAKVRGGVGVHAKVGHLALLDSMSGGWIQGVIEVGPHRLQEDHVALALRQAGRAFIERVLARHHDRLGHDYGQISGLLLLDIEGAPKPSTFCTVLSKNDEASER